MTDYFVPLILLLSSLAALHRRENSYRLLMGGAAEGLKLIASILPALITLLTAVSMFRASGGAELLSAVLSPFLSRFGIPAECAMLVLIRPISGSAALAVGSELMAKYGVDSLIGRTAAVMLGSTETTFYTLSVYCGAAGIRRTRYMLPAALLADLTGFLAAAWSVRLLMPK